MTAGFSELRAALQERLKVVADHESRDRNPQAHLEQLKSAASRLDAAIAQLPAQCDPESAPLPWQAKLRQGARLAGKSAFLADAPLGRRTAFPRPYRLLRGHCRDSRLCACQAVWGSLLHIGKMKAASSLLILIATIGLARAGSFAGAPPFTNNSPLLSGMDGIYQAVASGTNLTGVFSFQISGGVQTPTQNVTLNSWVFFVDGNVIQGSVAAAISQGRVAGVLNAGTANLPTDDDGSLILPTAFIIPGNAASGRFSGNISYASDLGAFSGDGVLSGTPERTDQLIFILDPATLPDNTIINADFNPVQSIPVLIPGSSFPQTDFVFQGTRVFSGAAAPATSGATTGTSSGTSPGAATTSTTINVTP